MTELLEGAEAEISSEDLDLGRASRVKLERANSSLEGFAETRGVTCLLQSLRLS